MGHASSPTLPLTTSYVPGTGEMEANTLFLPSGCPQTSKSVNAIPAVGAVATAWVTCRHMGETVYFMMTGTCEEVFTDGLMIKCSEGGKCTANVRH